MNMDLIQATLLALLQGVTEFLPISSSAHLILPSALLGWQDQGLGFDVAVHLGSLSAVIFYFRKELFRMGSAAMLSMAGRGYTADARLAWILLLATIPVAIAGFLLEDVIESRLRSIPVIALSTILFGLLLGAADKKAGSRNIQTITWQIGLIIGMAQILALVPGTSRSGITMTAALFCSLDRESASRFSFLLSIPVIAGAFLLQLPELLISQSTDWFLLIYAMLVTALTAYFCIHYFLKLIQGLGFIPFVVYRILLGVILILLYVIGN